MFSYNLLLEEFPGFSCPGLLPFALAVIPFLFLFARGGLSFSRFFPPVGWPYNMLQVRSRRLTFVSLAPFFRRQAHSGLFRLAGVTSFQDHCPVPFRRISSPCVGGSRVVRFYLSFSLKVDYLICALFFFFSTPFLKYLVRFSRPLQPLDQRQNGPGAFLLWSLFFFFFLKIYQLRNRFLSPFGPLCCPIRFLFTFRPSC